MKNYWFKRKYYGWGWRPATWQGWLVLGVYIAIIAVVTWRFSVYQNYQFLTFIVPIIIATVIMIVICILTGELPKWQWGNRDKNNSNYL